MGITRPRPDGGVIKVITVEILSAFRLLFGNDGLHYWNQDSTFKLNIVMFQQ